MAGNSQRRGAIRKGGKKAPTVGSGGQRRKGLEGRGPTPKAEERPYHKAHAAAKAIDSATALEGMPVPLHPGAERYYRETGLMN